jgi:ABC-type nickel/cobalt efflux system permease component RcnA
MRPMTRSQMTPIRRAPRRARIAAAVAGFVLSMAVPALAMAHPLGNFTINHYAGIRVEPDRVILDIVIDQAEIPTFQEKLRIDTDSDGTVSDAETEAERIAACPVLGTTLSLAVAGRSLALVPAAAGLSFPAGAAGLQTMRLSCTYVAALAAPLAEGSAVEFKDGSHKDRLGWREVVVTGSGVTVSAGGLPSRSVSNRLTVYPQDLLSQPLDLRSVSVSVSPGGPVLPPFTAPDTSPLPNAPLLYPTDGAGATESTSPGAAVSPAPGPGTQAVTVGLGAVPGGVGGDIAGLLQTRDLTPVVLLGSLLAAMALGAGHALTPGHGKTLMGAYLVGTRGTALHAVALGLSVTVSHTLGILVLAAVIIGFRGVVSPETFNRVAPVASGLLVLGIGAWLVASQLRNRRRSARAAAIAEHGHELPHPRDHDHPHPHQHGHELSHPHDHDQPDEPERPHPHEPEHEEPAKHPDVDTGGFHSHGGARHSHLPPTGLSLGWRSLFVLGLAGGIIPSTNALIILLATIATGRAGYGLVLVVAFGLGMAVVLGGVGLGLVLARDRLDRLPSHSGLGRLATYAPMVAGIVVFALGIYLTTQAVTAAPTL